MEPKRSREPLKLVGETLLFESRNTRCVAIDINGTLFEGYTYTRWEDVLEKALGLKRRKGSSSGLPLSRALTGKVSFEGMVAETYDIHEAEDIRNKAYNIYMEKLKPRDGCIDLLESLRSRYNLVVCSDTSGVTKTIVRRFGLERYFSKFFYSCEMGYVKSDLRFWQVFMASFSKMRAAEFVMIGDNPKADIRWPKTLGMGAILIESTELPLCATNLDDDCEPDAYVKTLDDIRKILL